MANNYKTTPHKTGNYVKLFTFNVLNIQVDVVDQVFIFGDNGA